MSSRTHHQGGRQKTTGSRKNQGGHGDTFRKDISEHDLLKGGNRYFKATFDFYTPRSHFIILANVTQQASGQSEVDELGDYEESRSDSDSNIITATDYQELAQNHKLALLETVESLRKKFSLNEGVFSIHRGTWVTNKNVFHTHLCVDTEQYIAVYRNQKSGIPDWPNSKHVTRQWRASRRPEDYEVNVRGYPFKSYHQDEVKKIDGIRRNVDPLTEGLALHKSDTWEAPALRLVFHPNQPRIGFALGDSKSWNTATPEGRLQLLDNMDWFAAKYGMTERTRGDESRGCHVCLVIDEAGRCSMFPGHMPVVGYIQMSGAKYYEMCPSELKNEWFQNFRRENGKNYT